MAAITAELVKTLRDKTGAGMMDCKTALKESDGEMEAAVDWLRAKGLSKAAKKADRVAAEGLIGVASKGTHGALVEINSETDFVARNAAFQTVVSDVAKLALDASGDVDRLAAMVYPGKSATVGDHLKELVGTIGENLTLRRTSMLHVGKGAVATYIHNQATPGMGKIGVLVALESEAPAEKLMEVGRQIAMHVAATNPLSLRDEDLDPAVIERERAILTEQAKESGKPANVIEKMIEGRIKKYYQEVVLLKQAFVINPDVTVEQAVNDAAKTAGSPITVKGFVRYELGEGIKQEKTDFAAEVAAAAGTK